jgi:hypothetical protein
MNIDDTVQAMQKLGGKVVKDGRRILKRNNKTTSRNTLYRDFDYLVKRTQEGVELIFEFGGAEDYWDFVDEGVRGSGGFKGSGKMRGHGSPFKFKGKNIKRGVIDKWIVYKPLKEARDKQGRFIPRKSMAFLIGRAIAQRGLTRTQFFTRPLTEQLKKQSDAVLDAFGNDLEKQLELVIGK